MAYISNINLGGATYFLKDTEARAAISTLEIAAASSLIFKGVVSSATEITELTNYKTGWTYKVSNVFYFPELGIVENGDMIVCISSYSGEYKSTDWTIIQNNIDVMQGTDGTNAGTRGLVPAPSTLDNSRFLRGDGVWADVDGAAVVWGRISDLI